jgi:hypothetical protein
MAIYRKCRIAILYYKVQVKRYYQSAKFCQLCWSIWIQLSGTTAWRRVLLGSFQHAMVSLWRGIKGGSSSPRKLPQLLSLPSIVQELKLCRSLCLATQITPYLENWKRSPIYNPTKGILIFPHYVLHGTCFVKKRSSWSLLCLKASWSSLGASNWVVELCSNLCVKVLVVTFKTTTWWSVSSPPWLAHRRNKVSLYVVGGLRVTCPT